MPWSMATVFGWKNKNRWSDGSRISCRRHKFGADCFSFEKEVTTADKDNFFDVLIESMPGDSTETKLAFFGVALFSVLIILIGVVRTLKIKKRKFASD